MNLVTTCLNYSDLLAVTLPYWKQHGTVHVVTTSTDLPTHDVCRANGLKPAVTDGWYRDDSTFNKGGALQDVIDRLDLPTREPMVIFDADCVPVGKIPLLPNSDHIYSCVRYTAMSSTELHKHLDEGMSLPPTRADSYRPNLVRGYFQLFQYHRMLSFGRRRDRTFSGCDLFLAAQFSVNTWLHPDQFYVVHLGESYVNWKGRVTEVWS